MNAARHILFPVDFSESCDAMAPQVAALAKRFGAKVTMMHVLSPYLVASISGAPILVNIEDIRSDVQRSLEGHFTKEFAGVTVDRRVELGGTAEVIRDFAEANSVDLVMMPTHGYGTFRQLLLGSVAAKVLHDCSIPVWTSAHVANTEAEVNTEVRSVLCAVDTSPRARDVLRAAAEVAGILGAQMRVVHVVGSPTAWTDEKTVREARAEIEEMMKPLGLAAHLCIIAGGVAEGVADVAARCRSDLVIIGRGIIQERLGRLRSNAYEIIRQSPCAVLSV
jgi:nucleotide-binding universal stress UspA family protein